MEFLNNPVEELKNFACEYKTAYATADSFDTIYFNDFFHKNVLKELLSEYSFREKTKNFIA
jgi:hypothetical protein